MNLDSLSTGFWITTLLIPVLLFGLNLVARLLQSLPASTGADWIILLLGIDCNALASPGGFKDQVKLPFAQSNFEGTFVVLVIMGFCLWVLSVFKLEPMLERSRNGVVWTYRIKTLILFMLSFALATGFSALHVVVFRGMT